jgi:riboflavin kinase/FMN adenylyltransferase
VIHGDKRGRSIGIPTANLELGAYLRPRYGIYAVRVHLPDGVCAKGVANLGIRPMFDPPRELLEAWILDWSGDLYGQKIEVELVEWLRPERKLDGLEALKAQIALDEQAARKVLA